MCFKEVGEGGRSDLKVAKETKEMDLGLQDYSEGSRERLGTIQNGTTQQDDSLITRAEQCPQVPVWLCTDPRIFALRFLIFIK